MKIIDFVRLSGPGVSYYSAEYAANVEFPAVRILGITVRRARRQSYRGGLFQWRNARTGQEAGPEVTDLLDQWLQIVRWNS